MRIRITDAATYWTAKAKIRPTDDNNDSHATGTGATPASVADAALRAAIDNSGMREDWTVVR